MKMLKFFLITLLAVSMVTACSENDTPGQETDGVVGYVVGYETCGLSLDNREAKGYIVISEDLKDTLTVYGLPEIFEFPEEAFSVALSEDRGLTNAAFPEKFRYMFKMRFTYTLSSDKEVIALELRAMCVISAIYPIRPTYRNCVPVIINSATKLETPPTETPPVISGTWEVKMISVSGKLTNIGLPPENASYSSILIEIPNAEQGYMDGHTFRNKIDIGFEITEHQRINIKTYGGTRIAEDEWGMAFSDHIRYVVKFDISNSELTFLDSLNNPVIVFKKN
jgi:hypothetical protein